MDMDTVTDDFRGDLLALQHGSSKARRAMTDRRHAVEQVRRLPRAGTNGCERFLVGGARVSQRDVMSACDEPSNQVEATRELRRQCHDPDVGRRPLDLGEDVGAVEPSTLT